MRARRRGSRRCRTPRPACRRRTPRSAPSRTTRRRATARTGRRRRAAPRSFVASSTRPSAVTPSPSTSSGASSSAVEPMTTSSAGTSRAQRLEGAQQHGQALALDGLADEGDPQRLAGRAHARRRRAAVGHDDAVAGSRGSGRRRSAGRSRRRPRRPRSARCRWLSLRRAPSSAASLCGGDRLRVAVERPDERRVGARQRVPADRRARPARGGGRRRSRPRAARGAASRPPTAYRRGSTPRRWTASRSSPPSGTSHSGTSRTCGRAPRCNSAVRRRSGSNGASTVTSWPARSNSAASASMWRVTPPGYVHEYGETSATRIAAIL